jgi:hypothetical protein
MSQTPTPPVIPPHTIAITINGSGLDQNHITAITTKTCELMKEALDSQLENFKNGLKDISTKVVASTDGELMEKMHTNFIAAFNEKLNSFSEEIAESDFSKDLINKLIVDLGLNFRDALDGGFDNLYVDFYAKFIKYIQSIMANKLGITEVDKAIAVVDEAMKKVGAAVKEAKNVAKEATEATEAAKNAAKEATEAAKNASTKAQREAQGNEQITTEAVTNVVKEVTEAAQKVTAAETLVTLKTNLETLKTNLVTLKTNLETLGTNFGITKGGRKKQIKTTKNNTKKRKQVKPKTKTTKNKTKKRKQVKPKTKPKTKTKRKYT